MALSAQPDLSSKVSGFSSLASSSSGLMAEFNFITSELELVALVGYNMGSEVPG